jgi:hypothetical protein
MGLGPVFWAGAALPAKRFFPSRNISKKTKTGRVILKGLFSGLSAAGLPAVRQGMDLTPGGIDWPLAVPFGPVMFFAVPPGGRAVAFGHVPIRAAGKAAQRGLPDLFPEPKDHPGITLGTKDPERGGARDEKIKNRNSSDQRTVSDADRSVRAWD